MALAGWALVAWETAGASGFGAVAAIAAVQFVPCEAYRRMGAVRERCRLKARKALASADPGFQIARPRNA